MKSSRCWIKKAAIYFLFIGVAYSGANNIKPFRIGEKVALIISSDERQSFIVPEVQYDHAGEGFKKVYTLTHEGATYLSVRFEMFEFDDSCWMSLSDKHNIIENELTRKGKQGTKTGFWGHHVKGDTMILTLECESLMSKGNFLISEYSYGFNPNLEKETYDEYNPFGETQGRQRRRLRKAEDLFPRVDKKRQLSICDLDDKRNAQCWKSDFGVQYDTSKAVARLVIDGINVCTGWLVGPNGFLLTNEHCIQTNEQALNTDFEFMYESSAGSCELGGVHDYVSGHSIYDAESLVAADVDNDWALIKLRGNPAEEFGYLDLEDRLPENGEQIYIPQHPAGRDKAIAILDTSTTSGLCQILANGGTRCISGSKQDDVRYSCDTEGGSSGSPVLSLTTNKVIALHHCGGACFGNHGVPMTSIFGEISAIVYNGSDPTTAAPTPVISESPTRQPCIDHANFTHVIGYDYTTCDWIAEKPEIRCEAFGDDERFADEDGDNINDACCVCGGGTIVDHDYVFPSASPSVSSSPSQTMSSPPTINCFNDPDFTHLTGFPYADCEWMEQKAEIRCEAFGGERFTDENGISPSDACCVCGGGLELVSSLSPSMSPTLSPSASSKPTESAPPTHTPTLSESPSESVSPSVGISTAPTTSQSPSLQPTASLSPSLQPTASLSPTEQTVTTSSAEQVSPTIDSAEDLYNTLERNGFLVGLGAGIVIGFVLACAIILVRDIGSKDVYENKEFDHWNTVKNERN